MLSIVNIRIALRPVRFLVAALLVPVLSGVAWAARRPISKAQSSDPMAPLRSAQSP